MTTVFKHVGPYDIVEEIGRGGMAAVFLAEDTRTRQKVALKLVPLREAGEGRQILDAERWGARLQASLCAECTLVPRVFEEGDIPPYYFIAMEYVEGENLSDIIARGPSAPADAVAIGTQLCRFLQAAHRLETTIDGQPFRSLLHGDLKPGNVRVKADGEIKVLDFGIAKALSLSRKVTRNDFGSMPYMSPERLDSDEPKVDAQADLWALGVILYELLSGAPPFHSRDSAGLERQIKGGYGARPLNGTVPQGLRAITAKLLAPALDERYPSAAEVLEDLQRFAAGSETQAETAGFPTRLLDAPTRRTRPAGEDDEAATRRTRPERQPAAAVYVPPPPRPRQPIRWPRLRTVLTVIALLLVANEWSVGFAAKRVGAAATTQTLDELGGAWDDYQSLSRRSYLRIGVIGLERTMRARVRQLTDEVIANYRSRVPSVRERQWLAAQTHLQQALTLSPGDRRLRAALRYCEGHLDRINGEAEKHRRNATLANRHFNDAISAFREAAELRADWPDPFLGLARTFIYGLEDVERAADAMKQAERRGYTIGEREAAQLGDGYRIRGENLRKTAQQLAGMPQEEEYLQRATTAYGEAMSQYERISGFPGVATNLRRTRRALNEIERRRAELSTPKVEGAFAPGPSWE
ncbi:MAG TPA: serine/threonine-protein kinase [Vicinamibacterales bacterium]|nr:serine/threonine-protein kinase [Vicinamibacterales bacterium]